ncbi:phosphohydrolase [Stutzerimonas stutzeri]|uniref:phosphohydrolase n=1 Tax=Stutzerimonas stutzeri TaxID=316 RepID=UPI00210B3DC2|nr:phosphohydrolase [Stutzerimonas stutzeri]MCQ4257441.1 phosphohydrolase [Stutzerimonas stutzeri]
MSWILTYTGQRFDLLAPRAELITTIDIAHALAHVCRFGGHTRHHYSVAQHSLVVASIVPPGLQLVALLHDATEAYVGDLVRPLKALLPDYSEIEHGIWLAICDRFNLDPVLPASIHEADMIALATERRDLMPEHGEKWPCLSGVTPLPATLPRWTSDHASIQYHSKLLELMQTHHRARALGTWERIDEAHAGAAAPQCM